MPPPTTSSYLLQCTLACPRPLCCRAAIIDTTPIVSAAETKFKIGSGGSAYVAQHIGTGLSNVVVNSVTVKVSSDAPECNTAPGCTFTIGMAMLSGGAMPAASTMTTLGTYTGQVSTTPMLVTLRANPPNGFTLVAIKRYALIVGGLSSGSINWHQADKATGAIFINFNFFNAARHTTADGEGRPRPREGWPIAGRGRGGGGSQLVCTTTHLGAHSRPAVLVCAEARCRRVVQERR